jgi:hypothetical protein
LKIAFPGQCRQTVGAPTHRFKYKKGIDMFKNTSLTAILFFACLTAHAENWRYCAANAPLNSPCKAWVSAYLAGHAPATDAQEVPRYQADSALARHLSAYHRSDIPAYGAPSLRAQQPFAQNAGLVIVR